MPLTHDELIYIARLLGNHVNYHGRLDTIAQKLLAYAERTGEWSAYDEGKLLPLKLEPSPHEFYPGRLMFREVEE